MEKEFLIEILTPGRTLLSGMVSEVVLPAYDGEVGILANHEDFIGVLGTGPIKIVREGNDYWFMASFGIYEVRDGTLTLYAELAEDVSEVDFESASQSVAELEAIFNDPNRFDPEQFEAQKLVHDRNQARLEIHRRTQMN